MTHSCARRDVLRGVLGLGAGAALVTSVGCTPPAPGGTVTVQRGDQ